MPKPYNPNDKLMRKAKAEGFRARSVYKLQEIDQRFKLFQPGQKVLDAGAAPGSWLQYTSQKIGPTGKALGLDLKPIDPIAENVLTKEADITDLVTVRSLVTDYFNSPVDLVISDLAPNTTGIHHADQIRSVELNSAVFNLAKEFLKPNGILVMKVFPGQYFDVFLREVKSYFRSVSVIKVSATRDRSSEVYVVCHD